MRTLAGKLDPERRAYCAPDGTPLHDEFVDSLGVIMPRACRIVLGIRR